MGLLIGVLIKLIIGLLFLQKVPEWIGATGILDTIIRVLGVLILVSIIFDFI